MSWDEAPTDVIGFMTSRIVWGGKAEAIFSSLQAKGAGLEVEDAVEAIRILVPFKRAVEYVKGGQRVPPLPWQVASLRDCQAILAGEWEKTGWDERRLMISELVSIVRSLDEMRKMPIEVGILGIMGTAKCVLESDIDDWRQGDDFGERERRWTSAVELLSSRFDRPIDLYEPLGRMMQEEIEAHPLLLATMPLPRKIEPLEGMTPSAALAIAIEAVVSNLDHLEYPPEGAEIAIAAWILEKKRDEFDRCFP